MTLHTLDGVFLCRDDATYERVRPAHAQAERAKDDLTAMLQRRGAYEAALADNRYSVTDNRRPSRFKALEGEVGGTTRAGGVPHRWTSQASRSRLT